MTSLQNRIALAESVRDNVGANLEGTYEDTEESRSAFRSSMETFANEAENVLRSKEWLAMNSSGYVDKIDELRTTVAEIKCPSGFFGKLWHSIFGGKARNKKTVEKARRLARKINEGLTMVVEAHI